MTATHRSCPFFSRRTAQTFAAWLLALCCLALPAQAQSGVTLGPGLDETLAAAPTDSGLVVLVTFEGEDPLTDAQVGATEDLGITQGLLMPEFGMMGVVATPAQVDALAGRSDVRSIWPNQQMVLHNNEATQITGVDALQADADFTGQNGGQRVDGRGVSVLVNDTGVDGLHPDLSYPEHVVENVQASMNPRGANALAPPVFVKDVPNSDVLGGHGTHVAGTVGGTGAQSGGIEAGVAPGADLIGYGSGAGLLLLDTMGGLYFALVNQLQYETPIRLVNNSWGPLNGGTFDPDNPVNVATKRLHDRGITAVFSAGNSGPGDDTLTPYAAPWVLTVAAGNKDGKTLAGFSSRGVTGDCYDFATADGQRWTYCNRPTITGPGVDVTSARNSVEATSVGDVYYTEKSGTSMSSPHVAGIAALLLDADPQLTFEELKGALTETATPMESYAPHEVGAGYVNAYAATAVALGLDPAPYLGLPEEDLPLGVVLTDEQGDATLPGTDLTRGAVVNETADAFEVVLRVADLDEAVPSTLVAAGLQFGAMQEYGIEFDLQKEGASTQRYTLSARRTLVEAGADGSAELSAPSYDFGVRAADGSGRGLGALEGIWDAEAGEIIWIVPKGQLDVAATPTDLTGDVDRSGGPAATGDVLRGFGAAVATSVWGGVVGITPGQTTYDEATGSQGYTLTGGMTAGDGSGGDGSGTSEPATKEEVKRISPVLECVAEGAGGSYTARFGYRNENDRAITLPVGRDNRFHPKEPDRGQPTTFEPGRHRAVFDVTFTRPPVAVWKLGRRTATAVGPRSQGCAPEGGGARVVTSIIDSGINPYHAFFNAGSDIYPGGAPSAVTPEVLGAFGIDAEHTLDLTRTGHFEADFAADEEIWDRIQPGEVYWFKGTNVLAVTFDEGGARPILPDDESDTHGVGTSAATLRANPASVLLFVEGVNEASETFAFTHPEVDVVSTSYGIPGSVPLPGHVTKSYTGVVENGKFHFGAADNSPSTSIQDGTSGPWWSIGVAGFEEGDSEGKQVLSGSLPDFVGDFTQTLPYCAACESGQESVGGTSFATPRSAGTMSKVILETRRALGHTGGITETEDGTPVMAQGQGRTLTNWQLRRALEEGAYYPTISDYSAADGVFDVIAAPVPPEGPYTLVGWGAVTPDAEHEVVSQTLAHLGVSAEEPSRTKSADACTFMTALIEARHAYWDNLDIGSESFMTSKDPYRYCGETSGESGLLSAQSQRVAERPATFALEGNFPNPFREETNVRFALPEATHVRLTIYDMLGRQVHVAVDEKMPAGTHTVPFEAGALSSGTYVYRLVTEQQQATGKMVLIQ